MTAPVGKYYTGEPIARELAEQVVRLGPQRGVLDPTCGDGRLLDAVRELLPGVPTFGMDRDPEAVATCRAKGHDARVGDSLFDDLPDCDVWVLNPPYLGGLKIRSVLGEEYRQKLKTQWPDVSGNADYCVYWLRRADDLPRVRAFAGVFTNTLAQGDTRSAGLRYLRQESQTGNWRITWAWRRRKWKGDKAAVVVSLVALEREFVWQEAPAADQDWRPRPGLVSPWEQPLETCWTRPGFATVERPHLYPGMRPIPGCEWQWRTLWSPEGWESCGSAEEGRALADDELQAAGCVLGEAA